MSRRTLRGRWEAGRLGKLDERLGQIDLLFGSVLLLARAAHRLPDEGAPAWLVPAIRDLENAVRALAEDPESPDARRRAGDSALEAARRASPEEYAGEADPRFVLVAEGVRQASSDVLRVAAPEEAGTADVAPGTPASGKFPSTERG